MSKPDLGPCPPRFVEIKKDIAASHPNFQERITKAWNELLVELEQVTAEITDQGTEYVPQVTFSELANLGPERVEEIRRKGSVVVRDVVDDAEASSWKDWLQEYVSTNPGIDGFPVEDKQFFQLYWTKSQVRARGHPNVLAVTSWLNNMYHVKSGAKIENVDLSTPLIYADRFRIRHPGVQWDAHPPHVDGGGIERWEDPTFRKCFADLLNGNWRDHDPYDLENRINARSSMYGRAGQATVFRTYQGWLAVSETAPREGTLQVFPSVYLSNAYTILRPFFRQIPGTENALDAKNWEYGTYLIARFPRCLLYRDWVPRALAKHQDAPTHEARKNYGDVVHAVEKEHTGTGDSAVMYIPAVPFTPQNAAYVARQKENFVKGIAPPDFPATNGEGSYAGVGRPEDIESPIGKRAMGFAIEVA
ncbi:uncharacterized protein FIBRA_04303 [Fibroporia radiculosa]|uniref:Uncharacterized protein n=1 Tax=Fibroporia radiculosa TaxID=599839 RepID=J4G760_9APHY|nr:uncharacterized protein FIBRA_04303 [Fibroporia radiculosa]CCM02223.1 predicted protein [Fibroporia radiculosa]